MLRDLSDAIASHLLKAFPPDRGYARVEFSREPMPAPVAHFLSQTLQSRLEIEVERHRSVRSDWFDYDHPDVQHAHLTFAAMLGQHAHIPKAEWERLLREAVHTVLSYLVRPVPTLVDFLFDEDDEVPVRDVYRGLAFFGPYPYLREVATTYLRQKNLQEVERSRFLSVLRHGDRQITHDYDATSWLRLLTPLFSMMEVHATETPRGIPVDVVDAFFEDKGAGSALVRLREMEDLDDRLTEDKLRRLLEEPPRPATKPAPSLEPAPLTMPEAVAAPTASEPAVAAPRPEIRQIVGPPRTEPPAVTPQPPAPEPAPPVIPEPTLLAEGPVARVERVIEQPTPTADQPAPVVERPVPVVERPAPRVERATPPVEHPSPSRPEPQPQQPAATPPKSVPLWQQFQKGKQPPSAPVQPHPRPSHEASRPAPPPQRTQPVARPVQPPARPAQPEPQPGQKGVPIWQQFQKPKPQPQQTPAQQAPSSGLSALERTVLGETELEDRRVFIEELFSGSVSEYERVLRRLQSVPSWSHASQVIAEEVFRKHQVNIYSEAAISFTNAVEAQYRR